jgi:hypothetical protein
VSTFPDPSSDDVDVVTAQLGRPPAGRFCVIVRRFDGTPVVIENEPHLRDGTPMPTLYWLVDPSVVEAVSRIEGDGGVHRYEVLVDTADLQAAHDAYAARRTRAIVNLDAPAPTGGVGGTRTGVKCLHAHVANALSGHHDPVGALVVKELNLPPLVVGDTR